MLSPVLVHWSGAIRLHDCGVEGRCKGIGLTLHLLGTGRELTGCPPDETGVAKEVELPSYGRRRCLQLGSDFAAR